MSSQIKIFKQDVINFLSQNLNENNIEEYISEIKLSTNLNLTKEIIEKGYKMYKSEILIDADHKKKFNGFGRSEYEALFNCLKNLIEFLLQDEKMLENVRGSMKMFIKMVIVLIKKNKDFHNKENIFENNISNNYKNFTLNYNLLPESSSNSKVSQEKNEENPNEALSLSLPNKPSSNEADVLSLTSTDLSKLKIREDIIVDPNNDEVTKLKKELHEKNLIILEMEKLILDIMNENKKIIDHLEKESNPETYPNYFKCPISWEKMENPVITNEGHSYEKWALEKWLNNQNTSPVTGLVLTDRTLTNNYNLKASIDDFHKRQNRIKKLKIDFQKFITKSEYDLNDLKKFFHINQQNNQNNI